MRFQTSERDASAGGRSDGARRRRDRWEMAATCIWSPSDRCSYMDPGLGWYLPAGAATEASFYTLLIHTGLSSPTMKRVLIPVRALIGWRDRGRLIEAFDRLREEQRGQVCSIGTEIPLISCMTPACIMYASYTSCH